MQTHYYRLLDYFVNIVDCRSLQNAASRMNVSAPVVSKALADLENYLQQTLVIRSRGQFKLTQSGENVYKHAKQMTRIASTAINCVKSPPENLRGKVTLTAPSELCLYWFPQLINTFKAQYPDVQLSVLDSDEEVDLARHGCDLAIRAEFQLNSSLAATSFRRLPVMLVCSPKLLGKHKISAKKQIESLPFIGFGFRRTNQQLQAIHRKSGKSARFVTRLDMLINSAVYGKQMAVHEQGMALVLAPSAKRELELGSLVSVADDYDFGYVNLRLIYRDQYPSAPTSALGMFIESYAG